MNAATRLSVGTSSTSSVEVDGAADDGHDDGGDHDDGAADDAGNADDDDGDITMKVVGRRRQ